MGYHKFTVILEGLEAEEFGYDTIQEAISGAATLVHASLECWEDDDIQRTVTIQCWPNGDEFFEEVQ